MDDSDFASKKTLQLNKVYHWDAEATTENSLGHLVLSGKRRTHCFTHNDIQIEADFSIRWNVIINGYVACFVVGTAERNYSIILYPHEQKTFIRIWDDGQWRDLGQHYSCSMSSNTAYTVIVGRHSGQIKIIVTGEPEQTVNSHQTASSETHLGDELAFCMDDILFDGKPLQLKLGIGVDVNERHTETTVEYTAIELSLGTPNPKHISHDKPTELLEWDPWDFELL